MIVRHNRSRGARTRLPLKARIRWRAPAAGGVGAGVAATARRSTSRAQAATAECPPSDKGNQGTAPLTARDRYVSTPDGNSIYSWGYSLSSGHFQLPGPVLCVTSGQTVTVVLHNELPEATSIVFPGQHGVTADGNAAQPQFDATSHDLTSMVQSAAATSGSVTYQFKAGSPGTYLYTSGTDVT